MAKRPDSGKREIKVNRRQGFEYDNESLSFLASRSIGGLRHTSSNSLTTYCTANSPLEAGIKQNSWSDIDFVAAKVNGNIGTADCESVNSGEVFDRSPSRGQCECGADSDDRDLCFCFGHFSSRRRGVSSTRLDFVDKYSILSVSPTCHTDTSDMSNGDKLIGAASACICEGAGTCEACTGEPFDLAAALTEALGKIDLLTTKMTDLEAKVDSMKGEGVGSCSDVSRASRSRSKVKSVPCKKVSSGGRSSSSSSSGGSDSSFGSKSRGSKKSSKKSRIS